MADQILTVRLRADGSGLVGTLRLSERQAKQFGDTLDRTGRRADRFGRDVEGASSKVDRMSGRLSRAQSLAAAFGATLAATAVVRASDTYGRISSQLDLVGISLDKVYQISQRTFTSFESTSRFIFGLASNTNIAQDKILRLTELINQALSIDAATQQGRATALFQLTQGLSAGALRGEDFNAVLDQSPTLIKALGKELGLTTGELREFAFAGKLTPEVFLLLLNQADELGSQFSQMSVEVRDALENVQGAFVKAIGESSEVQQATGSLTAALIVLAEHMPELISLSTTLLKVMVGYAAIKFLAPMLTAIGTQALFAAGAIRTLGVRGAATYAQLSLMSGGATAARGAMALLGGPVGVAAAAIGGLILYVRDTQQELQELARLSPETMAAFSEAVETEGESVEQSLAEVQTAIDKTRQDLEDLRARRDEELGERPTILPGGYIQPNAELESVESGIDNALDKLETLQDKVVQIKSAPISFSDLFDIGQDIYNDTIAKLDEIEAGVVEYVESIEQQTQSLKEQRIEMTKGTVAVIEMHRATALAEAVTQDQRDRINEVTDALIAEVRASNALTKEKEAGNDARRTAAALAAEEEEAVSRLVTIYEDYLSQVDPAALAQRELNDVLAASDGYWEQAAQRIGITTDRLKEIVSTTVLARGETEKLGDSFGAAGEDVKEFADTGVRRMTEFERKVMNLTDSISRAFGDFVTGAIDSWKEFGDAIKDIARRFLSDLIAMFARPIIVKLVGSFLGVMGMGGAGYAQAAASLLGGGGGAGGGFNLQSLLSMGGQGGSILGLFGGGGGGGASPFVSTGYIPQGAHFGVPYTGGLGVAPVNPGLVGVGGAASWMGALGGAYFGSQRGSGGLSTGLSTLTGGVAGYAVGGALAAGLSGGASAALAAMGPVGWAALAIMAIDVISGGKLFGTDWAPTGNIARVINIGAGGAGGELQIEESREEALFGGTDYRTRIEDLNEETQTALREFFERLTQSVEMAADRLEVEIPQIVSGQFTQQLNEEGEVIGSTTTIAGRTYTDETFEQFQMRVTAENLIAVVAQFDAAAQTIANRWRSSAETLLEGAQFLGAAAEAIKEGNALIEGDNALTRIAEVVTSLQNGSETLLQTYQRITAATTLYEQALAFMGEAWTASREALIEHAAAIAEAAGGIQRATQLWQTYFANFVSVGERAEAQLQMARDAAAPELADVGLGLGITRDAFRQAFESAMASDLAPEAKAEWLEAAAALAAVLNLEAQLTQQRQQFFGQFEDEFLRNNLSDFQYGMVQLSESFAAAMEQGRELGLTTQQLAIIQSVYADRAQALIASLEQGIRDTVAKLYGSPLQRQLDAVNARIADFEASSSAMALLRLPALYEEREDIQAQMRFGQRIGMAQTLAQQVADLAGVRGIDDFASIASEFGFSLDALAQDLGIDRDQLRDYFEDLQAASYTLDDLTSGMDLVITSQVDRIVDAIYIAAGIREGKVPANVPEPIDDTGNLKGAPQPEVIEAPAPVHQPIQGGPAPLPDYARTDPSTAPAAPERTPIRVPLDLSNEDFVRLRDSLGPIERLLRRIADQPGGRSDRGG